MSKLGAKRGPYRTFGGKPTRAAEIKIMLESHGNSDLCLVWPHKLHEHGYGLCHFAGKEWRVHRLAYLIIHGELDDDIFVLHSCDNPPCFNGKHLFVGTQADNLADMRKKGRGSHGVNPNPPRGLPRPDLWGEKSVRAKLTTEKVLQILKYLDMGCTQQTLADEFGVNQTLISAIKRGITWKHLSSSFTSMTPRK